MSSLYAWRGRTRRGDIRACGARSRTNASIFALDQVAICMVTTRPPKTIVEPTALGPVRKHRH